MAEEVSATASAMFSMDTFFKSILLPSRRITPEEGETPLPEALDTQDTMKQFLSDRILKAARVVYSALIERSPGLIRDRKHHLKTYRQCCSGKELVDWLIKLNECFQSRSQAVGMWQVLVDEGIIVHVKQELNFHDKDTQFYRFLDLEFGLNHMTNEKLSLNHMTNEKDQLDDELQEGLSLLLQIGPDALLTMILRKCPSQRSAEDLEVIYEELLHVKAAAHLSTSVRKELAAVLMFESHAKAGTVLFSQGDKGTSWYIIWKGSVNVITHGKGLVTTLHEGEDFGQLALVNDAPRAATIILREDNCHFLRVDKQDFIRILKDVEANTMRLEEHGKAVLVLEKAETTNPGGAGNSSKYTVMAGTPEKILEHLLETVKLDTNGSDAIDPCVSDFLLTHRVFMPSSQLCPALQHHYHAEPSEGSDLEKAAYALNTKQKIVKLICQWVALFGQLLKDDPIAVDFLERLGEEVAGDSRLSSMLREQLRDRRRTRVLENELGSLTRLNHQFDWFSSCEEPVGKCLPIRSKDKVLYEIFRPDHTSITLMLPVNTSVQEMMSSLVNPGGDHALVKMNSMGDRAQLKLDATAVYTSLGLNERLFLCTASQVEQLMPLKEQQGPDQSTIDTLEQMCSKDIASQLTNYDWELFTAMHEYWVVTEVCLCADLMKRAMLLKKFIKMAAIFPTAVTGCVSCFRLKEQKNLNSFFAVMFGLSNSAVQRLYKTWERVPSKTKRVYCAYERLMDPSRNHRAYRLAVAKLSPPYIPFMPLLLKDMTFIHEGNKNYTEKLVNFEKMRMIAKTVKIVRGCRSTPYVPSSPQKGLADRMFLEAPSIRVSTYSEQSLPLRNPSNIRHYVQNFEVIDNQRKLTQLSRGMER
ncbi:rap guanine nucleotide exchange factor 3-like isoform X6 [Salvelinus fontinalis]|uniref:rap guanine nucleotide exchange factor 3-like isoform X6 n=1 Tax=Salvelinus fontinalis TaxID=8038 RepID=UPI002485F400|nr:rap guanine nucleotide exchange factor 3-like isoform X6 [Salvelinus fontinalis]